MRALLCWVGFHRWRLIKSADGDFWRKCDACGKERLPPAIKQQFFGL